MAHNTYIHGTDSAEQERLTLLNRLTNQAFSDFLVLNDARSILEIGSGLGLLAEQIETELQMFMQCADASIFFYWNRASGRKAIR